MTSNGVNKTYDYDPYGNPTYFSQYSANDTNPIRYSGEYYDSESGLIYLRNRYYNPSIGRFISRDTYWNSNNQILGLKESITNNISAINTITQSSNLYAYSVNNPINYVDPDGCSVTGVGTSLSGGFGLFLSGQAFYVWDDKGNKGIAVAVGYGGGYGGGKSYNYISFPKMDTIYDLEGHGGFAGMSLGIIGAEFEAGFGNAGFSVSVSKGNEVSFQGGASYTWILYDF